VPEIDKALHSKIGWQAKLASPARFQSPPGDKVSGDMDTDIMPAGEQSIDFLLS
jgi:hypothetical protein